MNTLVIEWKHLDVDGETCDRCSDTGDTLIKEIKILNETMNEKGIEIILKETKLEDADIEHSNEILFNGVPIEEILSIKVADNYCESCSTLVNADTYCRTIIYNGNEYEDIPAKAIHHAAYKVLGLPTDAFEGPVFKMAPSRGCNSGGCC